MWHHRKSEQAHWRHEDFDVKTWLGDRSLCEHNFAVGLKTVKIDAYALFTKLLFTINCTRQDLFILFYAENSRGKELLYVGFKVAVDQGCRTYGPPGQMRPAWTFNMDRIRVLVTPEIGPSYVQVSLCFYDFFNIFMKPLNQTIFICFKVTNTFCWQESLDKQTSLALLISWLLSAFTNVL